MAPQPWVRQPQAKLETKLFATIEAYFNLALIKSFQMRSVYGEHIHQRFGYLVPDLFSEFAGDIVMFSMLFEAGKPILTTDIFHRTAELGYDLYVGDLWSSSQIRFCRHCKTCRINVKTCENKVQSWPSCTFRVRVCFYLPRFWSWTVCSLTKLQLLDHGRVQNVCMFPVQLLCWCFFPRKCFTTKQRTKRLDLVASKSSNSSGLIPRQVLEATHRPVWSSGLELAVKVPRRFWPRLQCDSFRLCYTVHSICLEESWRCFMIFL